MKLNQDKIFKILTGLFIFSATLSFFVKDDKNVIICLFGIIFIQLFKKYIKEINNKDIKTAKKGIIYVFYMVITLSSIAIYFVLWFQYCNDSGFCKDGLIKVSKYYLIIGVLALPTRYILRKIMINKNDKTAA